MDDTVTTGPTTEPEVAIDEEFGRLLVQAFNDLQAMPVHLLFNQWWSHAPQPVTRAYVEAFLADAGPAVEGPGGAIADPVDLDAAGRLPEGTLGRRYHDWIVENGLQATIAMDYRGLHDMLVRAGMLDGMPEVMQQAVLRGFQVHDFQHVLTGYDPSGLGEIALQSFCLAQIRFPYFSMWMSVITSRMTFVDPTIITAIMARFEAQLSAHIAVAFFVPALVFLTDSVGTQSETIAVRTFSNTRCSLLWLLWLRSAPSRPPAPA
jgi:hypothetical protein